MCCLFRAFMLYFFYKKSVFGTADRDGRRIVCVKCSLRRRWHSGMEGVMNNRKRLSLALVLDIIALAIIWLMPDAENAALLKTVGTVVLVLAAAVLLYMISRKKETEKDVRIIKVDPVSQMNPNQYLSKGGPVCAGSDNRYQVTFLLQNDLRLTLSLSAKQAGALSAGMRGTLVYNDTVFLSFIPDK